VKRWLVCVDGAKFVEPNPLALLSFRDFLKYPLLPDLVKEVTEHNQRWVIGHSSHLACHVADVAGELR
jgi:hypothetical protein